MNVSSESSVGSNKGYHFLDIVSLDNGNIFFSQVANQGFASKDLLNLGQACRVIYELKIFQTCLKNRHVAYIDYCVAGQLDLLKRIGEYINNSDEIISKYFELGENFRQTLEFNDCFYGRTVVNGLMSLFIDKLGEIDCRVVYFLNKILSVSSKRCFIEKILWFNYHALFQKYKGFDLLKQFTINFIEELNEQERAHLKWAVESMHGTLEAYEESGEIFDCYAEQFKCLESLEVPKSKSKSRRMRKIYYFLIGYLD